MFHLVWLIKVIFMMMFCAALVLIVVFSKNAYYVIKNSSIPKRKILIVICGFCMIMMMVFMVASFFYSKADSYKMGGIEIPSISYVLNERRSIVRVETVGYSKTITYDSVDHPTEDIAIYVDYLLQHEGFELVESEKIGEPSQRLTLHKEYTDLQAHIVIHIEGQISYYILTIQTGSEARRYAP